MYHLSSTSLAAVCLQGCHLLGPYFFLLLHNKGFGLVVTLLDCTYLGDLIAINMSPGGDQYSVRSGPNSMDI